MENTREKNKRSDGRKRRISTGKIKRKPFVPRKQRAWHRKKESRKRVHHRRNVLIRKMRRMHISEPLLRRAAREKEQFLKKTLKGIVPVKGMVGMENPYHYRNKVNSAFARKKTERSYPAFMKRAHTKWFRSMSACSRISVPMPSSAISAVC